MGIYTGGFRNNCINVLKPMSKFDKSFSGIYFTFYLCSTHF